MLDLTDLTPDLRVRVDALIAIANSEGISVVKTSGLRTFAEQADLYRAYREGRHKYPAAAPGLSRHHGYWSGLTAAVDLSPVDADPDTIEHQKDRLGILARDIALVWGGDWKTPDRVHFELPGLDPWTRFTPLCTAIDAFLKALSP